MNITLFMSVQVGRFQSPSGIELAVTTSKIRTLDCAEDSFIDIPFEPFPRTIEISSISIRDLGFTNGARTTEVDRAMEEKGYGLCPPEVAIALLQQHGPKLHPNQDFILYSLPFVGVHVPRAVFTFGVKLGHGTWVSVCPCVSSTHWKSSDILVYDTAVRATVKNLNKE